MSNTIFSTSNAVRSTIIRTIEFVKNNGGFVHPELSISVENNNLSVLADNWKVPTNTLVVHLPDECLPSTNDAVFSLKNNQIIIESISPSMGKKAQAALELIVELFNLTDKVSNHKENSLLLYLYKNNPDIYRKISTAHSDHEALTGSIDDIILKTFFDSRAVSYYNASNTYRHKVLMPVIDWLNHASNASGLNAFPPPGDMPDGLSVFRNSPSSSNECVFCYDNMDALNSTFFFNFFEPGQNYLRSIPMQLKIDKETLAITRHRTTAENNQIPSEAQDISSYYPIIFKENNQTTFSTLIIPPSIAPRSMRRILEISIRNLLGENHQKAVIENYVRDAESRILKTNTDFYEDLITLSKQINHISFQQQIIGMAKHNLEILKKYKDFTLSLPYCFLPYHQ